MMIIVSYDICTLTKEGQKRLRAISKICQKYGQRVQNSLFECSVQYDKFVLIKSEILKTYNALEDSIRFYVFGNNWEGKIEHFGTKPGYNPEGLLLF